MEKILMGKVVNVVGLKGEVKIYSYTDRNERFEELEQIWLDNKAYAIENVRYQNKVVILKLEGINDRNKAEEQRNKKVYIEEADLQELPEERELWLSALAIGDVVFAGFPGEPFTEIGRSVKKNSPFALTIPSCCSGGYEGYFPMMDAYDEEGYEKSTARFVRGTAEKLIEEMTELINAL